MPLTPEQYKNRLARKVCVDCGAKFRGYGRAYRCSPCTREMSPVAQAARRKVQAAILRKELIRLPCKVCGNPKSEGHHDDYSKPLKVRWLCRSHHQQHHEAEWKRKLRNAA